MNDCSLIKFLWSIFLQLNGKCWCCQHEHRSSNARISIPPWKDYRFTRNRYLYPVHCWLFTKMLHKTIKTLSNAIHSKNHWKTQTLLKQILRRYHIYIYVFLVNGFCCTSLGLLKDHQEPLSLTRTNLNVGRNSFSISKLQLNYVMDVP